MKGFGYVEFNSVEEAKTAAKGQYALDGRDLTVNMAGDRPSFGGTPRGGRGGRGGGFGRGRGGGRGRGAPSPGAAARKGAIQDFAGKKMTFNDSD